MRVAIFSSPEIAGNSQKVATASPADALASSGPTPLDSRGARGAGAVAPSPASATAASAGVSAACRPVGATVIPAGMPEQRAEPSEPVTLAHIRSHGCCDLLVYCSSG